MQQSLMCFAFDVAPAVEKAKKTALDKQQDSKRRKKISLFKKMIAIQNEYANALTYIDMYQSPACSDAKKSFNKLNSRAAKLETIKVENLYTCDCFGWRDLHHGQRIARRFHQRSYLIIWLKILFLSMANESKNGTAILKANTTIRDEDNGCR